MKYIKHKGKIYKVMCENELTYDVLPYNQPNEKYNPMDCKWVNKKECEDILDS